MRTGRQHRGRELLKRRDVIENPERSTVCRCHEVVVSGMNRQIVHGHRRHAIVETRLAAYPELSAVRLLDEIRAAGYTGGYSQLKVLVRRLRPTPAPAPVVRFETPAGHQAQVDFAQFRFPWGVRHALLVVLGYSRLLWCRFYRRQDMATLYDGPASDRAGGFNRSMQR